MRNLSITTIIPAVEVKDATDDSETSNDDGSEGLEEEETFLTTIGIESRSTQVTRQALRDLERQPKGKAMEEPVDQGSELDSGDKSVDQETTSSEDDSESTIGYGESQNPETSNCQDERLAGYDIERQSISRMNSCDRDDLRRWQAKQRSPYTYHVIHEESDEDEHGVIYTVPAHQPRMSIYSYRGLGTEKSKHSIHRCQLRQRGQSKRALSPEVFDIDLRWNSSGDERSNLRERKCLSAEEKE